MGQAKPLGSPSPSSALNWELNFSPRPTITTAPPFFLSGRFDVNTRAAIRAKPITEQGTFASIFCFVQCMQHIPTGALEVSHRSSFLSLLSAHVAATMMGSAFFLRSIGGELNSSPSSSSLVRLSQRSVIVEHDSFQTRGSFIAITMRREKESLMLLYIEECWGTYCALSKKKVCQHFSLNWREQQVRLRSWERSFPKCG